MCLIFYPDQLIGKLDAKLKICNTLGLSSLRTDLENDLVEDIKEKHRSKLNIEKTVSDLSIAYDYKLNNYLSTFMARAFHFISLRRPNGKCHGAEFTIDKNDMDVFLNSSTLPKEIAYELVKNSIKILFHDINDRDLIILNIYNKGYGEMLSILNFFDHIFYDDNVIDILPKNKRGEIFQKAPFQFKTRCVIGRITCGEDFVDRATLIVENKRIHVKSFILTDNSPVFKTMLQSTSFKEGQTKTIELPGKSLDEVVYFLEFLRYPKQIDGKFNYGIFFFTYFYPGSLQI